jgi:hypothetical protein
MSNEPMAVHSKIKVTASNTSTPGNERHRVRGDSKCAGIPNAAHLNAQLSARVFGLFRSPSIMACRY